jgi:hypothetical protein
MLTYDPRIHSWDLEEWWLSESGLQHQVQSANRRLLESEQGSRASDTRLRSPAAGAWSQTCQARP